MSGPKKHKFVKDWFNRRAEDAFTHVDDSKRLFNWDFGRSSYSSYFTSDDNAAAKDAGKILGSMFKVLGVPANIKNSASAETVKSALHSKDPKIHIPIKMLKDENGEYIDSPTNVDAFYGACIQNAAMVAMQTTSEYSRTMAPHFSKKKDVKDLLNTVLNGERIANKIGERFPGYLKFVQKYKDYTYDENYEELPETASKQAKLLDLVVKMIRYPAHINEEDLAEFEKPIQSIERSLKRRGGIPGTYDECSSLASSIAKVIYEYKEEEPPADDSPDDGEGDGDGEDGGEDTTEAPGPMFGGRSGLDELAKKMMNDLASEMDDHEELATEDQAAFDDFDDATKEDNSTKTWSDVDDGESIPGEKVFFDIVSGNKGRYIRDREKIDLAKAQTLARLFQRKNKDYEFSMRGMRSGRLDTGKLAEAKQHVPTIYERVGQVKTNKICVGVLIDESGSMGGEEIEKARQAAIFLNEVFKKMSGVELFIYGHSADIRFSGATEINVYKEPGKVTDMYALGSVHARSENRDGTAILATAQRIRKRTKNNGILFVLSDGGPCARGYHGASAIADVRKKVHEAENLGFQVIQIAINTCVPSKDMFNHYITMTDIKNLPKDMVTYMSRKVDHLIKERVFV